MAEAMAEPTPEPMVESLLESTIEPMPEPMAEPMTKPTPEPTPEPIAAAVSSTVSPLPAVMVDVQDMSIGSDMPTEADMPTGADVAAPSAAAPASASATPPNAPAYLSALPPLAEVLAGALPKGPVGTLQQQADASMMLLRTDWKAEGVIDVVQSRCHATLHFIDVLSARAEQLGALKGTLFQALMARHNAEQQRQREAEERRIALEEEQARLARIEAGETDDAADVETLDLPEESENAARATLRSREGRGGDMPSPLPPVLQSLHPGEIEALGADGAELRALLRIKVEDDQDIRTAQQALAECGYFLLLLREEAPKRELTEAALLRKLELGDG